MQCSKNVRRLVYALLSAVLLSAAVQLIIVTLTGYGCTDINFGMLTAFILAAFSLWLTVLVPAIIGGVAGYKSGLRAVLFAASALTVAGVAYESVKLIPHPTALCRFDL